MIPSAFDYIAPQSLDEAVRALADHGEEAKLLAGGHSLLPLLKLRIANAKLLIDLGRIPGLVGISQKDGQIVVGALTTHYQIESSELVKKKCPLLSQTACRIGDVQVRNRGTIGGSLTHADPCADWPAAILALSGEILTAVRVSAWSQRCGSAYLKMAQQASGFAIVGVAVWLRVDRQGRCEEIGVGLTGLAEKPFRARPVEEQLRGNKLTPKLIEESAARAAEAIDPLEDLHAAAPFRAHLARVYTSRAIHQAVKRATSTKR
jgi:carbon-monoxide dehydrogenase medium subunit